MNLRLDPVIPGWLTLGLLALAATATVLTLRRCAAPLPHRLAVLALRLAALALLAAVLCQPAVVRTRTDAEKPALAVLIDTSASLGDTPGPDPQARARRLQDFLAGRAFRAATGNFAVKWYRFGAECEETADPASQPLEFAAPRSHVVQAIGDVVERNRGTHLAGIVVLSDGLDQSTRSLPPAALKVPLFIPALEPPATAGAAEPGTGDTFIADLDYPKLLVAGWKGEVTVSVKRDTAGVRAACPVQLYQGTELRRTATAIFAAEDRARQVAFTIEPATVGRQTYTVEITPAADRDKDNNVRQFAVDVTDPKNRVLYLEGTPRWEFKYLKRALLQEKNYQLSAFVQSGPGVFVNFSAEQATAQLGGLPELSDATTLNFRAVILGELPAAALSPAQQETLARYVEKGGGLFLVGGATAYGPQGWPAAGPLEKLLPFTNEGQARMTDGRFAVSVTDTGRAHPIFAGLGAEAGLPPVLSLWLRARKRPAATVLLETPEGAPVFVVSAYGKGKVAALLTDSLWRWQLGQANPDAGKSLYEQFISQVLYWLSPQRQDLEDSANLQLVTAGAEAEVRQRVAVGAVIGEGGGKVKLTCQVTTPDHRTLSYDMLAAKLGADLGLAKPVWGWRAEFVPHVPGEYDLVVRDTASGAQAKTRLLVTEPQLEKTGKPANQSLLRDLATRTGGRYYAWDERDRLMGDVPSARRQLTTTAETPLWNHALVLVVLLALFCAEWYFRSRVELA